MAEHGPGKAADFSQPVSRNVRFEQMNARLLHDLEKSNDAHQKEGEAIMKAFEGALYPFDLLAIAVLNRSMSLTSGFISLMRRDNFVAAAPLIRLP